MIFRSRLHAGNIVGYSTNAPIIVHGGVVVRVLPSGPKVQTRTGMDF
jgi:hypothetical protein